MEEENIKSLDLDHQGSIQDLRKVSRQGNRTYQVLDENITMVGDKAFPNRPSLVESEEKLDEVASGESLFKAFAFDNAISKEETEKCLSFWRSVVEKNLEPIKCSLMNNMAEHQELVEKKPKVSDKKPKRLSTKAVAEESKVKPQRNVWYEALSELQEKRYKETKLLLEKRCRFCGYTSSPGYQADDSSVDTKKMLEELSTWEPKSHKRQSESMGWRRSSLVKKAEPKSSATLSETKQTSSTSRAVETFSLVKTDESKAAELLKEIKEKASKIQYVDAIQIKKDEGSYVKWRQSKVEACKCQKAKCDCSSDPGVKAILDSSLCKTSSPEPEVDLDSCAEQTRKSTISQPIHTTTGALELVESVDKVSPADSEVSADKASEDVEPGQEGKLTELYKDSDLLRMSYTSRKFSAHIVSPKSSHDEEEQDLIAAASTSESSSADDEDERSQPEKQVASKVDKPTIPRKSILKSREEVHNEDGFTDSPSKRLSKRRMKKSLSVVIACTCSNSTCDCGGVLMPLEKVPHPAPVEPSALELIKRKVSVIESDKIEDGPDEPPLLTSKSSLVAKSVDSLELIKYRLSTSSEEKVEPGGPKATAKDTAKGRTVSIVG